jgi:hypothetical protein
MFALALFALSVACLLTAPIAIAVALAVVVWGSIADVEVAVVVSRRRHDGARGQRVMGSIRMTPRKAIGALARTVGAAVETARRWTETARRAFGRWTETETAGRWADRARAAADVGPAAGVLAAVWALPWAMLAAPDGAAAAAGALAALALARHLTASAGLRYRADG